MIDKTLFGAVTGLFTLSLIMSYSLSEYTVIYYHYQDFHFFLRQLVAIVLGIFLMAGLSRLDPDHWFVPIGFSVFLLSFGAMIAMPFMPETLVKSVLGAKRWIRFSMVSLAPAEFFKVGFVFFLAWSFSRKMLYREKLPLSKEAQVVFPYLLVFGIAVVLIAIFQKDLGQVVVLAATMATLFIFAGRSIKLFFLLLLFGAGAFAGLVLVAPHRMVRMRSWWSTVQDDVLRFFPESMVGRFRVDAAQEPYQIANSLNAIKNGDFWGQGLGAGQFKLGYLSEVHTDFVLSGITEELGLVGLAVVMVLMMLVVYRLFKIAASVEKPMYYIFSTGAGLLIAFALLVNSYGVSGITPIKGIAVPFLSYGGSQILASSLAVGMVLMVSKRRIQ